MNMYFKKTGDFHMRRRCSLYLTGSLGAIILFILSMLVNQHDFPPLFSYFHNGYKQLSSLHWLRIYGSCRSFSDLEKLLSTSCFFLFVF